MAEYRVAIRIETSSSSSLVFHIMHSCPRYLLIEVLGVASGLGLMLVSDNISQNRNALRSNNTQSRCAQVPIWESVERQRPRFLESSLDTVVERLDVSDRKTRQKNN